jgi:hypothetical protein
VAGIDFARVLFAFGLEVGKDGGCGGHGLFSAEWMEVRVRPDCDNSLAEGIAVVVDDFCGREIGAFSIFCVGD